MRRNRQRSGLIAIIATLGMAALWFLFLRPTFLGGPVAYIMVSGRSMEPTLYEGDLAVMAARDQYQLGDIVAFRAQGGVAIHRIVGGTAEAGYAVKGDNNANPDAWLPRPEHIAGAMVVKVPLAGSAFGLVRNPVVAGSLVAALGMGILAGEAGVVARRRRRMHLGIGDRGYADRSAAKPGSQPPTPNPQAPKGDGTRSRYGLLAGLSIAGIAAVIGLVAAAYAWWSPSDVQRSVERARYEHSATFTFSAEVEPSALYGNGRLDGAALVARDPGQRGTPIYTKLLRVLDVGFRYQLASELPPEVSGTVHPSLRIKAGEGGWVKTMELVPPTAFTGPSAQIDVPLDTRALLEGLQAIEEETGHRPTHYEITVIPTVAVAGRVGGEPLQDQFSPPFTFRLNRTELLVDAQLLHAESKTVNDAVFEPRRFSFLGMSASVETLRWVTTGAAATAALVAAGLAVAVYRRRDRGELSGIRSRYGSVLIDVVEPAWYQNAPLLTVASFHDLARLAQRDGGFVFHYHPDPGTHRYFVPDNGLTYEYRVMEPLAELRPI